MSWPADEEQVMALKTDHDGQRKLAESEARTLKDNLNPLQSALDAFPKAAGSKTTLDEIEQTEAWAKSTSVLLFNIFRVLSAVPYRTRLMDKALEDTKQSFHAVFELVFCTIRRPQTEDRVRAKLAVEAAVSACMRLV